MELKLTLECTFEHKESILTLPITIAIVGKQRRIKERVLGVNQRIDLIICRNLLFRLDGELQRQLCSVPLDALKPDGYLFLGSQDSDDTAPELFRPIDRDARLYVANPAAERAVPVMPPSAL
jgi:CheR methyltransferase, SAM binding domain